MIVGAFWIVKFFNISRPLVILKNNERGKFAKLDHKDLCSKEYPNF